MLRVDPYDDLGAKAVFDRLDADDWCEAGLVRGGGASAGVCLWADWRAHQPQCLLSFVLRTERCPGLSDQPFAVLSLSQSGQSGVALAAFLAKDHRKFRRPIVAAVRRMRETLPEICIGLGLHRIEARSWADHPRAGRLLRAVGFRPECLMPGFGPGGTAEFLQWAYLPDPTPKGDIPCA